MVQGRRVGERGGGRESERNTFVRPERRGEGGDLCLFSMCVYVLWS